MSVTHLILPIFAGIWIVSGSAAADVCAMTGRWLDPTTREQLLHTDVVAEAAHGDVVLLGERHDDIQHHRWQLHVIAALHARHPDLRLGFEMFPRRAQPILDLWTSGALSESAFLQQVEWDDVWGFDADFYLPVFHFARMHKVPMIALNVDRALVRRVGRDGWAAVPDDAREGVGDPAPPDEAYRRWLAEVYAVKARGRDANGVIDMTAPAPGEVEAALAAPGFVRFVEAQLTWDRAMAEALDRARADGDSALVVGLVGQGHAQYGWGIPHQLGNLGVVDVTVLLPVAASADCSGIDAGLADAVFLYEALPSDSP